MTTSTKKKSYRTFQDTTFDDMSFRRWNIF